MAAPPGSVVRSPKNSTSTPLPTRSRSLTSPAISPSFSARNSAALDPSPSGTAVSPMAARCATNHSKSCAGSRRSTTAVIGMPSSASQ